LKDWEFLLQNSEAATKLRMSGKQERIHLYDRRFLIVSQFAGRWYIGLHTLSPNDKIIPTVALNFNMNEWAKLMEKKDMINEQIVKLQRRNREDKSESNYPKKKKQQEVQVFVWKWYNEEGNGSKHLLNESDVPFFTKEDCSVDAWNNYPDGYDTSAQCITLEIVEKFSPPPHCLFVIRECYISLMKYFFTQAVTKGCEACQVGSDSQSDHAKYYGCIDPCTDHWNLYFDDVFEKTDENKIFRLYNTVKRFVGITQDIFSTQYIKAARFYIPKEAVIQWINNPNPRSRNITMVVGDALHIFNN